MRSPTKTIKSDLGNGGLIQPLAVLAVLPLAVAPIVFSVRFDSVVGLVALGLDVAVGLMQPCLRWRLP